jgi:hypothetical protein
LPFFFLLLLFRATAVHSSLIGRGVGGRIVRVVGWCCLSLTLFPGYSEGSFIAVAGAEQAGGSVSRGMDSLSRASSLETTGLITTLITAAMSVSIGSGLCVVWQGMAVDTILTPFSLSPMTDTAVDSLPELFLAYCTLADSDDVVSNDDRVVPRGSGSDPVPLLHSCALGLSSTFLSRTRR